jgi:hypothetical protein
MELVQPLPEDLDVYHAAQNRAASFWLLGEIVGVVLAVAWWLYAR